MTKAWHRPTDGDPFAGEDQGHRDGQEEGGQSGKRDQQLTVAKFPEDEVPDVQDVEGGQSQGDAGDPLAAVCLIDQPEGDGIEDARIDHQGQQVEKMGLRPVHDLVQERHRREQDEECDQKRHDLMEVRGGVAFEGRQHQNPVGGEAEVIDQRPALPVADAEDADAQGEQVAVQSDEVHLAGGEHDRRAVAADDSEDRHEHRVEADGDAACENGNQPHEGEGGDLVDEAVEVGGGEDAEVEGDDAASHQPLPHQVVATAEQLRAADEHAESRDGCQGDAGERRDESVVDRVLQEEADADNENDDADAKQPLTGDGIFHRHALGDVFFADDDPVPDPLERFAGGGLEAAGDPLFFRRGCGGGLLWGTLEKLPDRLIDLPGPRRLGVRGARWWRADDFDDFFGFGDLFRFFGRLCCGDWPRTRCRLWLSGLSAVGLQPGDVLPDAADFPLEIGEFGFLVPADVDERDEDADRQAEDQEPVRAVPERLHP